MTSVYLPFKQRITSVLLACTQQIMSALNEWPANAQRAHGVSWQLVTWRTSADDRDKIINSSKEHNAYSTELESRVCYNMAPKSKKSTKKRKPSGKQASSVAEDGSSSLSVRSNSPNPEAREAAPKAKPPTPPLPLALNESDRSRSRSSPSSSDGSIESSQAKPGLSKKKGANIGTFTSQRNMRMPWLNGLKTMSVSGTPNVPITG